MDGQGVARQLQRRLSGVMLVGFVLVLGLLLLTAPSPKHLTERVLSGVLGMQTAHFDDGFGELGQLARDQGGRQPVPYQPDWVPHPQFRDDAWLLTRDPAAFTLQVGVFSTQEPIRELLSMRTDADQFAYVHVRDPAQRVEPSAVPMIVDGREVPAPPASPQRRYILTYGTFASDVEARQAAEQLMGLGDRPFVRPWSSLQQLWIPPALPRPAPAAEAAMTVDVVRPGESAETVPAAELEDDGGRTGVPVYSLPFRPQN